MGERLLVDVQQTGGAHCRLAEAQAICGITLAPEQQGHHDDGHYDACRECADAGTKQTEARKGADTIDKHKVARNVEHIAHEYDPHAGRGFGYAVGKLAQGIEQCYKQERGANGQIVGPHQWQYFGGLPHAVNKAVTYAQNEHEQQGKDEVAYQAILQGAASLSPTPLPYQRTDEGGQTIAIT